MAFLNLFHVDLEKLKIFISFVLENPTVLNMPQLKFLKELIEKFGGKVPAGEFKMPTDVESGKRPFCEDAQETGVNTETVCEVKMDESGPETESEIELDMKAPQSLHDDKDCLSEPQVTTVDSASAVYLEDTNCYRRDRRKLKRKRVSQPTKKEKNDDDEVPLDEHLECNVEWVIENSEMSDTPEEDPIDILPMCIPPIKTEPITTQSDDDDEQDDDPFACGNESDSNYRENSVDTDDDEPLIKRRLRKRVTRQAAKRGRRKVKAATSLYESKRTKKPKAISCGLNCKYSCSKKIDAAQRNELCKQIWALSFVERKDFLLTCIERKPLGPMRTVKTVKRRDYTKHYFLSTADGERIRVCMRFFQSTLNISNYLVNEAMMHSDGGKYLGEDMRGGSGPGRQAKLEAIKEARAAAEAANKAKVAAEAEDKLKAAAEATEKFKAAAEAAKKARAEAKMDNKVDVAKHLQLSAQAANATMPVLAKEGAAEKQKTAKLYSSNKDRNVKRDRVPRPVKCEESCKWKCHTHFSEEQRREICSAFGDMSFKRRKDFVLSRIETHDISQITADEYRKTNRAQRAYTNRYFFRGERGNVRVCAHFFMATLSIARHFIQNAQNNIDKHTGMYTGEDKRGRYARSNKIDEETQNMIRRHIESYPTWMPHKNYKRRFLHSSLSKSKIYSEYKQQCENEQRKAVSFKFFMKIFDNDFRLSFLKPTSKHAHKISPQKKTTTTSSVASIQPEAPAPKVNPNISEFTGEEGGFWVNPMNVVQLQYPQQQEQTTATSTIQYAQPAAAASYTVQYSYEHHHPVFQAPSYGEQHPNLHLL